MVVTGSCTIAVGLGIIIEALQSLSTGPPIVTSADRALPTDWWWF
jgi:hypothetical protein